MYCIVLFPIQLRTELVDLKSYLLSSKPNFEDMVRFSIDICNGLLDLHERGFIHQ